jgi:hypothetical protein
MSKNEVYPVPANVGQTAGRDNELLVSVATRIRDAFRYDPGHSDLDNEQPIHISVTLRDWRELNYALNKMKA